MNKVIHKQVIVLNKDDKEKVTLQHSFEVPDDAELVDIQWDPRDPLGIAFWYTRYAEGEGPVNIRKPDPQVWRFLLVGTGDEFPDKCTHLGTVIRDGYAVHILDYDGNNIPWADL
jgi:hypothetical protein